MTSRERALEAALRYMMETREVECVSPICAKDHTDEYCAHHKALAALAEPADEGNDLRRAIGRAAEAIIHRDYDEAYHILYMAADAESADKYKTGDLLRFWAKLEPLAEPAAPEQEPVAWRCGVWEIERVWLHGYRHGHADATDLSTWDPEGTWANCGAEWTARFLIRAAPPDSPSEPKSTFLTLDGMGRAQCEGCGARLLNADWPPTRQESDE